MAKTIIKGGKNEFLGHCKWCGCDFRYTEGDVLHDDDSVSCPYCSRMLKHLGEHGTNSSGPSGHFELAYAQQVAAQQFPRMGG